MEEELDMFGRYIAKKKEKEKGGKAPAEEAPKKS